MINMPEDGLRNIPYIKIGTSGPVHLVQARKTEFEDILSAGVEHYGRRSLVLGDVVSKYWLELCENLYREEIGHIAESASAPGAYMLNLSFEWSCTSSTAADPSGKGNRLLRTLDWPMPGLGRNVVIAGVEGKAGYYENITWPGFVGVATAMAPGRFSAAINQPPMRRWTPFVLLDWGANRCRLWRRRAIPPAHLLRKVFDECSNYRAAKEMLMKTPIALPSLFTLSGSEAGEGCVIEREEDCAYVRETPATVANHWVAASLSGRSRGIDSQGRYQQMETNRGYSSDNLSWLKPPILNRTTRIAVVANARRGLLIVQGLEEYGPATHVHTRTNSHCI